jgi:hypothetical protein
MEPVEINISAGLSGGIIKEAEFVTGEYGKIKFHGECISNRFEYFIV